ncbi:unnamed protein product, partial [Staurois parvus]
GSGYLSNSGTHSHFCCNHLGYRKLKFSSYPPSPKSYGTCDRYQKTTGPFRKHSATRACAVGTRL